MIADLNPNLRGWGNYFGTVNASDELVHVDHDVECRVLRLMSKQDGRSLKLDPKRLWRRECFEGHGLYRRRSVIG
jgi:RNA-directed DNA polymerase